MFKFNNHSLYILSKACFYMSGCLVIIIWPLWGLMNATASSSVMGPVFMFKGLFVQCAQYMGGQYQCDNYLNPVFDQSWNLILGRNLLTTKNSSDPSSDVGCSCNDMCVRVNWAVVDGH